MHKSAGEAARLSSATSYRRLEFGIKVACRNDTQALSYGSLGPDECGIIGEHATRGLVIVRAGELWRLKAIFDRNITVL